MILILKPPIIQDSLFSKLIADKTWLIELLNDRVETVRIHKVDQVTSGLVVFIDDIDIETIHYIGWFVLQANS